MKRSPFVAELDSPCYLKVWAYGFVAWAISLTASPQSLLCICASSRYARNIAFLMPHVYLASCYLGEVLRTGTPWEDAQHVWLILERQHLYPMPQPPAVW